MVFILYGATIPKIEFDIDDFIAKIGLCGFSLTFLDWCAPLCPQIFFIPRAHHFSLKIYSCRVKPMSGSFSWQITVSGKYSHKFTSVNQIYKNSYTTHIQHMYKRKIYF